MRCIFNNRTTKMTSFSIGTNPTIGTKDHWFDESYLFVYIGHVCLLVHKNRLKYKHVMRIVRFISFSNLPQNKFSFTPSRNALIVIMNIPRSISQPRKTISLSLKVETR